MPAASDFAPALTAQPSPSNQHSPEVDKPPDPGSVPATGVNPTAAATVPGSSGVAANAVTILSQDTANVTVQSTTSETTLWSYTVPGSVLGSSGCLRMAANGTWQNFTGAQNSFQIRVYYGATKFWDDKLTTPSGALLGAWMIELWLEELGAVSLQRIAGNIAFSYNGTQPTTGHGTLQSPNLGDTAISSDDQTVDTTVSQVWKVTVQPSASSNLLLVRRRYAVVTSA